MGISAVCTAVSCSTCGEPLNARGDCVACLFRNGLDQSGSHTTTSQRFGDFEVARRDDGSLWELGRGGMGVTYLAIDTVLQRRVALKVIELPQAARSSRAVRERLLREARAAAALRHPNVAAVFQFGTSSDGRHCYYAMELVEGKTLEARVRREGPLPAKLVLEIATQIVRALMAAAAQGLIHRDLKPSNIMLTDVDELEDVGTPSRSVSPRLPQRNREIHTVKVIDFGLAKALTEAASEMDLTHGEFVGTPNFASPEQFESGRVDARSDIYSLGATMWFALTGLPPHSGKTLGEIRVQQMRDVFPVQQLHSRNIPEPLIKLLRSTLSVDPARRPASARELLEALESCRRRLSERVSIFYQLAMAATIVAVAGTALIWGPLSGKYSRSATLAAIKSLAVLPLKNYSSDATQEYFADGITEALITELARVKALRVMSRASVMQYKQTKKPLHQIGRELNVDAILTGSVTRFGDHASIAVQLTHAGSDRNLWSESYERSLRDLLTLQKKLARDIVSEIRVQLTPQEQVRLGNARPVTPEAYDHYLHGQFYFHQQTRESNEAAIAAFERAVRDDSSFAAGHAALAQAYVWKLFLFSPNERKWAENAFVEIEKALALDPNLGLAYLARGRLLWTPTNRFPHEKAIREYRRALDLDPSLDEARNQLALVYCHVGLFEEALQELRRAVNINPNNNLAQFRIGETLLFQGKYEEALAGLRGVPWEVNPSLIGNQIAMTLLHLGRNEEAAATLDRLLRDFPEDNRGLFTSVQAIMAALEGDVKLAEEKITTAIAQGKGFGHFHHTAYHIACAYALMNKIDDAVRWLEHAADDGFPCYPMFTQDSMLNNLRQDPRFDALMARLRVQWDNYRGIL